jgi:hypothetical protein
MVTYIIKCQTIHKLIISQVSFTNNTVNCVPSFEEKVWMPQIHDDKDYYSSIQMTPEQLHFFVNDPSKTDQCTTVRLIQYQHFEYDFNYLCKIIVFILFSFKLQDTEKWAIDMDKFGCSRLV